MDNDKNVNKIYQQGSWNSLFNNGISINWLLTHMCNYSCSYCFSHNRKIDANNFSTKEQLHNAVKHIIEFNRSYYDITISGGEPTIHPNFFFLIEQLYAGLKKKLNSLLIISNGSRDINFFKKLKEIAKENLNMKMNLSLHSEHVKMEHICEIISEVAKIIPLHICVMFNPDKRPTIIKILDDLLKLKMLYPFSVDIVLLRMPPRFDKVDNRYQEIDFKWRKEVLKQLNSVKYKKKIIKLRINEKFFESYVDASSLNYIEFSNRSEMLKNGLFNFKNMYCSMGTTVLAIKSDGSCKGSQCKLANKSKFNIYLDNPYKDEDFIKSTLCTEQNCGCSANDRIMKFANEIEAENFINVFKNNQNFLMFDK